jgi:hypothetical protein
VFREVALPAAEIGRVHRYRGELDRAREIETELHGELEEIRTRLETQQPPMAELNAEARAARQPPDRSTPASVNRATRPAMSKQPSVSPIPRGAADPANGDARESGP